MSSAHYQGYGYDKQLVTGQKTDLSLSLPYPFSSHSVFEFKITTGMGAVVQQLCLALGWYGMHMGVLVGAPAVPLLIQFSTNTPETLVADGLPARNLASHESLLL